MTLISPEPHPLASEILLFAVGILGFFALRRWRWAVAIIAPAAIILLWRLTRVLIPTVEAAARPDFGRYMVAELALGALAVLLGIGLPVLGWRRPRPAA